MFFIYASAALAGYRRQPPTARELAPALETAWDTHLLSENDLSDPDRMTRFLEDYFAPSAPDGGAGPQLRARRCRKTSR